MALLLALGASATSGESKPVVVIFGNDRGAEAETLLDELRIQLEGPAHLEVAPALARGLRGETHEDLNRIMEERSASLALSIEPGDGAEGDLVLAYATILFGAVEIGRISSSRPSDDYRAIALKAHELLDVVALKQEVVSKPSFNAGRRERDVEPSLALLLELGAFVSGIGPSGAAGGPHVGAGLRYGDDGRRVEAYALFRFPLSTTVLGPEGSILNEETDIGVGSRLLFVPSPPVELGAASEATLRRFRATGTTSDGRSGSSALLLPCFFAGAVAGWSLAPWIELRAQAGLELSFRDVELALHGATIERSGRLGPRGQLSVVLTTPP